LIIEDNVDAAETLAELLALWGHDSRVAPDGETGLELARAYAPEIVLLDLGLPGIDGYEVARRLRGAKSQAQRVIALTGYGDEEARERAAQSGFDHHLRKPVDPEALRALLAS
jgi:DNA-binding response OmpR family regulator